MITGIVGMEQGGTSAVAAVVKALGVTMYGTEMTLDDVELFGSTADRKKVVAGRTGDWAWKYPHRSTTEMVPETDRYILVFRDPAARAVHRRDLNTARPEYIRDGLSYMSDVLSLYKTGKPVLYVSYEKLLTKTPQMVTMIADFLGKPVTDLAKKVVDAESGYNKVIELNKGVLE